MQKLPPKHESMRGFFGFELYRRMAKDERIIVVTANLGYGLFDYVRRDFPNRFVDAGNSEQAGLGLSIGLAMEDKIPIFYSITTFLLYRPFELVRNYLDAQKIPVKLVGSGRDKDYAHDGLSHWSEDAKYFMNGLPEIAQFWPNKKQDINKIMDIFLYNEKPSFLSLVR